MEKFTNDGNKFLHQIKSELLEYQLEENWQSIFTYLEMPYFLTYAFSYNWSKNSQNSKYRLKRKEWNAKFDHARFDKGIYNLDRLAIVEKNIAIRSKDAEYFNSIDWKAVDTVEFKGVVLDGLICELQIEEGNRVLTWNVDESMNTALKELVYTMRNWKREMKEFF